jgi:hypothetical protein
LGRFAGHGPPWDHSEELNRISHGYRVNTIAERSLTACEVTRYVVERNDLCDETANIIPETREITFCP